ncbi:hypothetical protein N7468_002576 [Penicillium chermesinum]|uniref:Zn(2)-C6 fungal-type domain-containing protein n=1 Tax=Penicillium chermesinum TaxID=63820 RepID=A0A9W9PIS7_9EURO|nr:uncharacterized protein N7468_002576 [Penicillium chermesinum]KAJ5247593.1 hypothetical protein N7468_002576 [Penicillium chermesinum]KAJ6145828.1 hypothetical protein N7470_009723 [Penicillium chermesinum]
MPGILPMKVIKVGGTGSQSRIAQACDRCRSKKIRCDGVRPCCTQCANVGFECKTSDKLSRRAFPRGYTESLEERVRALEAEVKDLKDLLDEKDEKIDVLSRIHSFSPQSQRSPCSRSPPTIPTAPTKPAIANETEDVIRVPRAASRSSSRPSPENPYTAFVSTQGYADTLTAKLVNDGRSDAKILTNSLTKLAPAVSRGSPNQPINPPPRLVSDQLINIFFQEWAPLYPVVHRPTILKAYEEYVNNPESLKQNMHRMTQLNLIFGIAAISSKSRTEQDPSFFEETWSNSLDSSPSQTSLSGLQCFVLAQIYCMTKGDYPSLLRYRALAVDICHQLELHLSQADVASNRLEEETSKKVFWCQYTLDRMSTALTGMPMLLRESDIEIEYPVDIDDENVTEAGFLPALPGEPTRLSSALAFFGASRILTQVLENLYPSKSGYSVNLSKIRAMASQLDSWLHSLPSHLRLVFSQDKPSTNVTSSRSPLLSLVYYYIRSLIHRPAVCFAEEHVRSPSVLALSDSSKHIIQIFQLLDERRLCLSISINRKEVVFSSGLGLLWQTLGLNHDSKLVKESQKLIMNVIELLAQESSSSAREFTVLASTILPLGEGSNESPPHSDLAASQNKSSKLPKKQFQSLKSRLTSSISKSQPPKQDSGSRRNTVSGASPQMGPQNLRSPSWASFHASQADQRAAAYPATRHASLDLPSDLRMGPASLGYDNRPMSHSPPSNAASEVITMADWEHVLSDMDSGFSNIFNGIYGGHECAEDPGPFASITASYQSKPNDDGALNIPSHDFHDLSPEAWSSSSGDLPNPTNAHTAQSVLSYSGESMGSADDNIHQLGDVPLLPEDMGSMLDPFNGLPLPSEEDLDEYALVNGWDRPVIV